jgi:hypothetical protein
MGLCSRMVTRCACCFCAAAGSMSIRTSGADALAQLRPACRPRLHPAGLDPLVGLAARGQAATRPCALDRRSPSTSVKSGAAAPRAAGRPHAGLRSGGRRGVAGGRRGIAGAFTGRTVATRRAAVSSRGPRGAAGGRRKLPGPSRGGRSPRGGPPNEPPRPSRRGGRSPKLNRGLREADGHPAAGHRNEHGNVAARRAVTEAAAFGRRTVAPRRAVAVTSHGPSRRGGRSP